jgi:exopolysaccharide production protein ExoY
MQSANSTSTESEIDLSAPNIRAYRDPAPPNVPNLVSNTVCGAIPFESARSVGSFQTFSTQSTGVSDAGENEIPTWKRILDVVFILVALPVWLPIFLLIALWVKIVSPGPIFFRQERIGFLGKPFMILKFRTMKVNVETGVHERYLERLINSDEPMTKLDSKGDPRIIAGGRILRATGLDELPQLINVLRGDMSLVGPRPCTPKEFKHYSTAQLERVNVLPGLTGYWQVNGKNKTTFSQMIEMDIFYAKHLTLWLDLQIIFRTLPALTTQVIESRIAPRFSVGTRSVASSLESEAKVELGPSMRP